MSFAKKKIVYPQSGLNMEPLNTNANEQQITKK
jgi:hypothetical protein